MRALLYPLFYMAVRGWILRSPSPVYTGSSREIETTGFDPDSVFPSTHWRANNPASEFLPKETCSFYKRDLFRRFSKTLPADF